MPWELHLIYHGKRSLIHVSFMVQLWEYVRYIFTVDLKPRINFWEYGLDMLFLFIFDRDVGYLRR